MENHPLRLDYGISPKTHQVFAIIQTPNHQGNRGPRTYVSWHDEGDLIKDYGSVEAFFNHVDSNLVDSGGNVNEEEFVHAQRMGSDYTGWFEVLDVPE